MDQISITETSIEGLFLLTPRLFTDLRGCFVKVFDSQIFSNSQLDTKFVESYYSFSKKGVIRGMHFQLPPHEHAKLVYVPSGIITDVVVDVRKNSPTYGKYATFELSGENHCGVYLSAGLAHGFESLKDESCVCYLQTSSYSPNHDTGIRFDSFGMTWNTNDPIISERDESFTPLSELRSPFIY